MFFGSPPSLKNGQEVATNVYAFGELQMLDCNTYVFADPAEKALLVVDLGNGLSYQPLLAGLKKLGLAEWRLARVVVTHVHVDHLLGLYAFKKDREGDGAAIYGLPQTVSVVREADLAKIFPGNLGISPRMFDVDIVPVPEIQALEEGTHLEFGDFRFDAYHMPGHCPGSLVLHEPDKKILVSGDVVFSGGSFGRVDFPGGSAAKLIASLKRLTALDVELLLPGHMSPSRDGNRQIALAYKIASQVF